MHNGSAIRWNPWPSLVELTLCRKNNSLSAVEIALAV
jgi:hypothetical protein